MSKIIFSKEDIKKLKNNKNVLNVSERSITYTYDFKVLFIDEYMLGKLPREILTLTRFLPLGILNHFLWMHLKVYKIKICELL